MDIDILLALQDFRNGAGAFLAGFLSKMTWLGELNTALVIMALIYYAVSLILVPQLKDLISGAPGTFVSCYVQMFYVSFLYPWLIKRFEKA